MGICRRWTRPNPTEERCVQPSKFKLLKTIFEFSLLRCPPALLGELAPKLSEGNGSPATEMLLKNWLELVAGPAIGETWPGGQFDYVNSFGSHGAFGL